MEPNKRLNSSQVKQIVSFLTSVSVAHLADRANAQATNDERLNRETERERETPIETAIVTTTKEFTCLGCFTCQLELEVDVKRASVATVLVYWFALRLACDRNQSVCAEKLEQARRKGNAYR